MAAASPESVYKMAAIPVSPVEACANQLVSSLADTPMVLVRAASILKPPVSMTGPITSTEPARLIMSTEPAGADWVSQVGWNDGVSQFDKFFNFFN